jgi:hypothetical protein
MTLVFQTGSSGSLQGVQLGPADAVATISAAYSAWGWMNGLGGVKALMNICRRPLDEKKRRDLFKALVPSRGSFRVLVQGGLETVPLPEGPRFGDSEESRLVGLTICALAHNVIPFSAVAFFMEYLAPRLFVDLVQTSAAKESLHTFLIDNVQMILNEGNVLGLNSHFEKAISDMDLFWNRKAGSGSSPTRHQEDPDSTLIPAFLLWVSRGITDTYYTRSAAVTRIGLCLRAVGYRIDEIQVWDGTGTCPCPRRSIVLVIGGWSKTDCLQDDEEIDQFYRRSSALILHYRKDTVGAMLWNSFPQECCFGPETFQQDYLDIHRQLKQDLIEVRWCYLDIHGGQIQAVPIWTQDDLLRKRPPTNAFATRLATIFFPESVEHIAPYYKKIADQAHVDAAKKYAKKRVVRHSGKEIERFYTITACICLAVVARFAGPEFKKLRHATTLKLESDGNLISLCREIDSILSGNDASYSKVVSAVAALHCGINISENDFRDTYFPKEDLGGSENFLLIGKRCSVYSVLPRLLFSLNLPLEPTVLGLQCLDEFIANVPTRADGSVVCSTTLPLEELRFSNSFVADAMRSRDLEEQAIVNTSGVDGLILFGTPFRKEPDKPLYLSIERPPRYAGEPILALCGRVGGEALGYVGIPQVLATLALSWSDGDGNPLTPCPRDIKHEGLKLPSDQLPAEQVFNVPASAYGRNGALHPMCKFDQEPRYHSYVQVYGDACWTIYLAGQSTIFHRVVFGCPDCAAHAGENCNSVISGGLRFLIGYR